MSAPHRSAISWTDYSGGDANFVTEAGRKNITFEEWEARQMQDPKFRAAAERLDAERETVEAAIAEARLRPYQAMVIRQIAVGENVTAALDWIAQVREATDER